MRLKEDIKPIAYMKTRAEDLLEQVNESHRPVVITENGEARAVVLDIESYEALRDATLLLRIAAQGEADLQTGRFLPQDKAFARIRSRLKAQ